MKIVLVWKRVWVRGAKRYPDPAVFVNPEGTGFAENGFSLPNRLFFMLASVKKSFFLPKITFFRAGITFFSRCSVQNEKKWFEHEKKWFEREKKYFFSRLGKSHKKPNLYVPRWMGAHLTYLELSAGKDKQVIAF
jgi:hypothetical protein